MNKREIIEKISSDSFEEYLKSMELFRDSLRDGTLDQELMERTCAVMSLEKWATHSDDVAILEKMGEADIQTKREIENLYASVSRNSIGGLLIEKGKLYTALPTVQCFELEQSKSLPLTPSGEGYFFEFAEDKTYWLIKLFEAEDNLEHAVRSKGADIVEIGINTEALNEILLAEDIGRISSFLCDSFRACMDPELPYPELEDSDEIVLSLMDTCELDETA